MRVSAPRRVSQFMRKYSDISAECVIERRTLSCLLACACAGAVASIAFGEREPLVDGNVIRVLARLKAIASDPKNTALNNLCW